MLLRCFLNCEWFFPDAQRECIIQKLTAFAICIIVQLYLQEKLKFGAGNITERGQEAMEMVQKELRQ